MGGFWGGRMHATSKRNTVTPSQTSISPNPVTPACQVIFSFHGSNKSLSFWPKVVLIISAQDNARKILFKLLIDNRLPFTANVLASNDPKTLRVSSIAQKLIKALGDPESQIDLYLALYDQFNLEKKQFELSWKRGKAQPDTGHLGRPSWEIICVDFSIPDAKCIPAGQIMVCNRSLEHFETDAQIAAIIAPQIGYWVAWHSAEWMRKDTWKTSLKKALYYVVTPTKIEVQANYLSLMMMASAGYDPNVAMTTYDKLGKVAHNLPNKPCKLRSEVFSQTPAMEKAMKLYRAKNEIAKSKF